VSLIDGNHDFVEAYIREKMPLVSYTKAQGTYLAWLDVGKVVDKIEAKGKAAALNEKREEGEAELLPEGYLSRWFVENSGVQLTSGSGYSVGGAGHMSMNVATSRQLIKLALDNMAMALDKV